ncbi:MAG: PDZ domain-containing protein [Acidobacteriota bacterium]
MMKKSLVLGLSALLIAVGVSLVASAGDDAQRVEIRKFMSPCEGDDCPSSDDVRALFIGEDGHHVGLGGGPLSWVHGGGFLGVALTELSPELREHFGVSGDFGVIVSQVMADSPAETAGIEVGDIITGIDGEGVASAFGLSKKVRGLEEGEAAAIELWRDGRQEVLSVAVEERKGSGLSSFAFRCEDGECEGFDSGDANIFVLGSGDGDRHHIVRENRKVVVLDCDEGDCPEIATSGGNFDFDFDFDCGDEACQIEVNCDGGDCSCTLNGDDADCSALSLDLGD